MEFYVIYRLYKNINRNETDIFHAMFVLTLMKETLQEMPFLIIYSFRSSVKVFIFYLGTISSLETEHLYFLLWRFS